MDEQTKLNRSGIIKSRIFALFLLLLSCSLALVAFKSLGRSFDGMIMHKTIKSGFITNRYDLYINQDYKANPSNEISNQDILNVLVENFDDYTKVGVSSFAYEEAKVSMIITKKQGSPIIIMGGTTYIDQGLFWVFISLLGMIISNIIYKQTLIKLTDSNSENDDEELEL